MKQVVTAAEVAAATGAVAVATVMRGNKELHLFLKLVLYRG